ncbi:MAG: hypothetical protein Q7S60_03175 [bacterium]|nr:hypothetical protein [bacterium]
MAKRRVLKVFKNVISPVQAWLISQGRCVGCGRELKEMKKTARQDGSSKITCECGRIFILDAKTNKYRRALLEEV